MNIELIKPTLNNLNATMAEIEKQQTAIRKKIEILTEYITGEKEPEKKTLRDYAPLLDKTQEKKTTDEEKIPEESGQKKDETNI